MPHKDSEDSLHGPWPLKTAADTWTAVETGEGSENPENWPSHSIEEGYKYTPAWHLLRDTAMLSQHSRVCHQRMMTMLRFFIASLISDYKGYMIRYNETLCGSFSKCVYYIITKSLVELTTCVFNALYEAGWEAEKSKQTSVRLRLVNLLLIPNPNDNRILICQMPKAWQTIRILMSN